MVERHLKRWLTGLLCLMIVLTGCETNVPDRQNHTDQSGTLTVDFIDVGQGDATLLRCGSDTMMIDFGNNSKGTVVQKYLQDAGVSELTYAVGTHPDADHIGGMDVILYKFPTKNVWMPDISSDTQTYRDVLDVCRERGYTMEQPIWKKEYPLGNAKIKIMGPVNGKTDFEDKNEASLVVKVTFGKTSFLFCGDASQESETAMLTAGEDVSANVLKLGHHGSSTATGEAFLDAVNPNYAVISCGIGNSYGHPHAETMQKMKEREIAFYRTDLQGSIQAVSDAETIRFQQPISTDYRSGNETTDTEKVKVDKSEKKQKSKTITEETTYIVNKSSMKFHRPDCRSVKRILSKNREDVAGTREELISQGYEPCKSCNP